MSGRSLLTRIAGAGVLIAGLISLWHIGLLDAQEWRPAISNLAEFAGSLLPPEANVLSTLVEAMLETIEIAFVGTLLGFAVSLPFAFLASRTLFGPAVTTPVRLLLGA